MANIKDVISAIKKADSWEEFKSLIIELDPDKEIEPGYKLEGEKIELSEFDNKLKKALNWNPKEHK